MRFLKLASNWLERPDGAEFTWPYWVDVSVSPGRRLVAFAEGVGHGAVGGAFPVGEAVSPEWRKHLAGAEAEWLLPYLYRIVAGEDVDEQELVAAFTERHGRAPESYDWDV